MTDTIIEKMPAPLKILNTSSSGNPVPAHIDLERRLSKNAKQQKMEACPRHNCEDGDCGTPGAPEEVQSREVAILVHTCRGCQRQIFGAHSYICPRCTRASCSMCYYFNDGRLSDSIDRPDSCADCLGTANFLQTSPFFFFR